MIPPPGGLRTLAASVFLAKALSVLLLSCCFQIASPACLELVSFLKCDYGLEMLSNP